MEPNRITHRSITITGAVIGLILINLAAGLFGGVAGFVLLSTSTSKTVQGLRKALNLGTTSSIAVPVHENVTLQESSAVIDAANKVSPAVVAISTAGQVADYFANASTQTVGGGSGFIITNDGLILTNKHLVNDPTAKYQVVLHDGRIFDATVLASDSLNDLAVIKITAKDLPVVELGSSNALQVGQFVLSVGNSLGQFQSSVSSGILSAKDRSITAGSTGTTAGDIAERLSNQLQTDAAISPGNSGGPLVNLDGQVVGVDTAIPASTNGIGEAGYVIPIDSISSLIDSVRKTGQIIRPYLGIRYVPVTSELQQQKQLSVAYGVLVTPGDSAAQLAVVPGTSADKAGIVSGDIIVDINGEQITQQMPLPNLLQKYNLGDTISVDLLHSGKQKSVKLILAVQ